MIVYTDAIVVFWVYFTTQYYWNGRIMHAVCTNNVKEVNIIINCYKINLKQEKYYYNHFGHISEDELFIQKNQNIANISMGSNLF